MGLFAKKPSGDKPRKSVWRDWSEALVVAAILALIIRTFVVQAFKIPSGSMEDTLLIGDHLLVNKFVYGLQVPGVDGRFLTIREPQRGDIIVFEFPEDRDLAFWARRDFIKRVVGVPGDTIEVRNKELFVNGQPLVIAEAVHKEGNLVPGRDNLPPLKVPPGHYFAMGDNRDRSYDSRFWGFVRNDEIKGLAFIKYWSWDSERMMPRFERIGRWIE